MMVQLFSQTDYFIYYNVKSRRQVHTTVVIVIKKNETDEKYWYLLFTE